MSAPANIGPRGCARRRRLGLAAFAAGIAALAILWAVDAGRASRLTLFVPFWVGALGISQVRHLT